MLSESAISPEAREYRDLAAWQAERVLRVRASVLARRPGQPLPHAAHLLRLRRSAHDVGRKEEYKARLWRACGRGCAFANRSQLPCQASALGEWRTSKPREPTPKPRKMTTSAGEGDAPLAVGRRPRLAPMVRTLRVVPLPAVGELEVVVVVETLHAESERPSPSPQDAAPVGPRPQPPLVDDEVDGHRAGPVHALHPIVVGRQEVERPEVAGLPVDVGRARGLGPIRADPPARFRTRGPASAARTPSRAPRPRCARPAPSSRPTRDHSPG